MKTTSTATSKTATAVSSLSRGEVVTTGKHGENRASPVEITLRHAKTEVLICVVDHDDSLRRDVTGLLWSERYPIESFASAQSFLNRKTHDGPCCLVLDVHMRGLGGFNLQDILFKAGRTEQLVFVSEKGDVSTCAQAFRAGAVDFLTKPVKNTELLRAVENALLRSEQLFLLRKEWRAAQAMLDQLTPREREVLGFVIAGQLNKMIAATLGTTEKTIKKHRGRLMDKLKVGSVAELVFFSLQSGLKPSCPYGGLRSPIQA